MANYYASALAGGGGSGTIGSPFTFAEMIAYINASFVAGDVGWIKADGTYNFTTQQTITKAGSNVNYNRLIGYGVTPGDGIRAVLRRSSGSGTYVISCTVAYWMFENFEINGNALAGGMTKNAGITRNCSFHHCGGIGATSSGASEVFIDCQSYNNSSTGFHIMSYARNCISYNNGLNGIFGAIVADKCISYNNGNIGIYASATTNRIVGCISDKNIVSGITTQAGTIILDCIISNMVSGIGLNFTSGVGKGGYCSNINIYNCVTNTNDPGSINNLYSIDPQFTLPTSLDFTRSGNNMDGIGFSQINGINYKVPIGIAPNKFTPDTIPVFVGITSLIKYDDGIKAIWSAGSGVIEYYDVYIKIGTATGLFSSANYLCSISSSDLSIAIYTESDGLTKLNSTLLYYVGVKARNTAGQDINTASLSQSPDSKLDKIIGMIDDSHALILSS